MALSWGSGRPRRLAAIPGTPPCPVWGPHCPVPFTVYPELASTGMQLQVPRRGPRHLGQQGNHLPRPSLQAPRLSLFPARWSPMPRSVAPLRGRSSIPSHCPRHSALWGGHLSRGGHCLASRCFTLRLRHGASEDFTVQQQTTSSETLTGSDTHQALKMCPAF